MYELSLKIIQENRITVAKHLTRSLHDQPQTTCVLDSLRWFTHFLVWTGFVFCWACDSMNWEFLLESCSFMTMETRYDFYTFPLVWLWSLSCILISALSHGLIGVCLHKGLGSGCGYGVSEKTTLCAPKDWAKWAGGEFLKGLWISYSSHAWPSVEMCEK